MRNVKDAMTSALREAFISLNSEKVWIIKKRVGGGTLDFSCYLFWTNEGFPKRDGKNKNDYKPIKKDENDNVDSDNGDKGKD